MKNLHKIYLVALGAAFALGGCNKQLDLKPHQSIEQDQAILTAADVQITLVGAYNRMGLSNLYGGGEFLYPDLLSDPNIINWFGTFQELTQMNNQTIINDNGTVNINWLYSYEAINQANNVLANLSKVAVADKDRTEGEAKFIRGMLYFDMARLYGRAWNDGDPTTNPAVPIVTTPTTVISEASYVSRASVADVYAQAIKDLTDAEIKLPEKNSFFANKYAASAILARLYLQKGDYANAATEANKVFGGEYKLNQNYADEFPNPVEGGVHLDNTSEDIFAIQVTSQQGTNALNTFYASSDFAGRGDVHIKNNFLNNFETGDTRAELFQFDDPSDSTTVLRCHKFDNQYGNVHIIRLAEMYLIRAEANYYNHTSVGDTPLDDVNTIRSRAGLAPVSRLGISTVPTAIFAERVRELAFEGGFFLHDAKRLAGVPNNITFTSLSPLSPKLVFPIPQQDINANPKLKQNPGY